MYSYDPSKIEMSNGPIFKVEQDKDRYQRVSKQNNDTFPVTQSLQPQ